MSVKGHTIHKVTIKASPIFVCDDCGRHAVGDETTIESTADDAVYRVSSSNYARSSLMPIGWASYYLDIHKCPNCH